MDCKCISKRIVQIVLYIVLPILAISVVLLVLFPTIYNDVLRKELTLDKGTILTSFWESAPLPIYEKVYFFNITNKEAFMQGREPLNVTEVGPYTYRVKSVKNDPVWNFNATVTYREVKIYHFAPDMSNGTEDDLIYTLNGPMIIAFKIAKDLDISLRALLSIILETEGEFLVIQRNVRELLYEGYEDIIIKIASILKPKIPFKDKVFSWFHGKNATDDGLYTIFTGSDDPQKTGIINNWNGKKKLTFWKADTCNMLKGTNMEVGPFSSGNSESYTFFQSAFCRSITFNYTKDKTHYGLLSKRFRPTYAVFANSTDNPDNYCFEAEKERPSGLFDIGPCQFGAQVLLSFPHFYMADPSYLESVNGLNPNIEDHGSHLDVDAITGFTIDASLKFQINVEISKIEGMFETYHVTKGIFPVLWVEISWAVDDDLASLLRFKTHNPKIIAYAVLGVLVGICLFLAIAFLIVLYLSKSDDDDDPVIHAKAKGYGKYKTFETTCKNAHHDKLHCGINETVEYCKSTSGEYSSKRDLLSPEHKMPQEYQSKMASDC